MLFSNGKTQKDKAGLPPGVLVFLGHQKVDEVKISAIDYSADTYEEHLLEGPQDCRRFRNEGSVSWINVVGLHEPNVVSEIGQVFGLHGLLMEDILNTKHRPKVDEYEGHLFITLKMLSTNPEGEVLSEQISLVLGDGWVLSFQEQEGDVFDALRKRLRSGVGVTRGKGADYLFYRLLDTIVDNYFLVSDHVRDANEALEEYVLKSSDKDDVFAIHSLRRQILGLRRSISPLKDALGILTKDPTSLMTDDTRMHLRDVFDHIIQVNDSLDIQRDILSGIMDLHQTSISNAMNRVMQTLTITATIFIPLTFIAGIYGMNFNIMPELDWEYGYYMVLGLMFFVGLLMLWFFKRRNWF